MFSCSPSRYPISRFLTSRIYFSPESDPGAANPDPAEHQAKHQSQSQQPNIDEAVDNRIAELLGSKKANNDPMAALTISLKAQHKLETEVERLKGNQITDADRSTLQAANGLLQAYGAKSFDELKARLEAGDSAATKLAQHEKADAMRAACEAAGIDYEDLSTRKGVDDWSFEVKDENRDGKTVKVPYVTFKDASDKDVTKPLAEHAAATFPTLAKAGASGSSSSFGSTQQAAGKFVKQGVGSGGETTAERIRREAEERKKSKGSTGGLKERMGVV